MKNSFRILNLKIAFLSCTFLATVSNQAFADNSSFPTDPANRSKLFVYKAGKAVRTIAAQTQQQNPKTEATASNQKILIKKLELVGLKSIPPLNIEALAEDMLGKKVKLKDVYDLAARIEKKYKEDGYILTSTYVPEQSFANGDVKIGVIEGNLRDIKIEGDTESEVFEQYLEKIANLNPLTKDSLTRYLMLMKKIPGYDIEYELKPVKDNAAISRGQIADLYIAVTRSKAKFDANLNNYGSTDLGRTQFALGGELLNGFNKDETLLGFIATTNKPEKMKAATVGFKKIINSEGTTLGLLGSYATNSANINQASTTKHDRSTMARLSLSHYPFINNKGDILLEGGMQNNTQKIFNGVNNFANYHIASGFVGIEGKYSDKTNATTSASLLVDKGLSGLSKVTMYDRTVPAYNKNFAMVSGKIWRDQPLIGIVSAFVGANGQYSGQQLPPERQFIVGGQTNGRAYKNALVSTSKGHNLNAELRLNFAVENDIVRSMVPYGFYDIAFFSRSEAQADKNNLASAGGGVRFDLAYEFMFNFEVGAPLRKSITLNGVQTKNSTKYSFMVNKVFKI